MKNKLYKLTITYELVVAAANEAEIDKNKYSIIRSSDDPPYSTQIDEIKDINELPNHWDKYCIPWSANINSTDETMISEYFK